MFVVSMLLFYFVVVVVVVVVVVLDTLVFIAVKLFRVDASGSRNGGSFSKTSVHI